MGLTEDSGSWALALALASGEGEVKEDGIVC